MGSIKINLNQISLGVSPGGREGRIAAAFMARATRLLDGNGKPAKVSDQREMPVPLGGDGIEFAVPPGLWNIELLLPSGDLHSRQARVSGNETAAVDFNLGNSPHEWLVWQFVEGSVPDQKRYDAVLAGDGIDMLQSPRGLTLSGKDYGDQVAARAAALIVNDPFAFAPVNAVGGGSAITAYRLQWAVFAEHPQSAPAFWFHLANALRLDAALHQVPQLMEAHEVKFESGPYDRWHQVWGYEPNGPAGESLARYFALVTTADSLEFVSLPLPWSVRGGVIDRYLLELSVDTSGVPRPSVTSVTLRDPQYFGLLSYLKSGALGLAGSIAEGDDQRENMLVELVRRKFENPLAACAAAYALMSATDMRRPQHWHSWLRNLDTCFTDFPDGAILFGRYLLAGGAGKRSEVKQAYLRAFDRGLPFFSLGLSWLLEGLRQFDDPDEDAECIKAAGLVRKVAMHSDVSQVFTVLRFQAPRDDLPG